MSVVPLRPEPAVDPREHELRERFARGDRDAFIALAEPHLASLYTVALRITGDVCSAEDAAHDALVLALQRHRQYDPSRPLRPWLLAILTNQARDRVRRPWWQRLFPLVGERTAEADGPERACERADRDACVRHALSTLPVHYREILALYHLDDMTYEEMAAVTDLAVPALKQRVRRGSALLREKIERMYPDLVSGRIQE